MKTTYQMIIQQAEKEKQISAKNISEVLLSLTSSTDEEYADDNYDNSTIYKLNSIAALFSDPSVTIEANANAFHNIAVDYARNNMFDCAITVLERGLIQNKNSVDLLADTMLYGIESGKRKKSADAYKQLQKVGRERWNWRAYAFSIDYLLDKANTLSSGSTLNNLKKEAFQLADNYIDYAQKKPEQLDRAYFNKAKVYSSLGGDKSETELLLAGVRATPSAPMCSLRLSEIIDSMKDYDRAIELLKPCILAAHQTQPDINPAYAYLCLAMTKSSKLVSENIDGDYSNKEKEILAIYKDFHTVLKMKDATPTFKDSAQTVIKILEVQTGVKDTISDNEKSEFI